MQIITTHLNADFDCIASMVAAKKLYPDAFLVLSGSCEQQVNEFLKQEKLPLEFTRIKDVSLEDVELLVVVDTHDPKRIGIFAPLIADPKLKFIFMITMRIHPWKVKLKKWFLRKGERVHPFFGKY